MALPNGARAGNQTYEIVSAYGGYKDDVRKELQMSVPKFDELDWMRLPQLKGRMQKRKARNQKVSFYEEGDFFKADCEIAAVNTSVANQVTITLAASSHYDSGKRSFPVLGQLAVFKDETVGYVSAVNKSSDNAHTVTIYRQNTSQDVQAAAVVGDSVVFYGNEQDGGSKKTTSRIPTFNRVDNYLHTTREYYEVEDHEEQTQLWFEYKGVPHLYMKGTDETAERFKMQENLNLLLTPQADGVTHPVSGKAIRSASGLIPQITDHGINFEYFGNPDLTTFNDIELLLDANYGDSEYLFGLGINADQALRDWLVKFNENGDKNIKFAGVDKQEVNLNFKSLTLGSRKFHFQCMNVLSHAGSLGVDAFPYRHMMIGIPLGGGQYPKGGDSLEREYHSYLELVYAKPGGRASSHHEDVKIWQTGANAEPYETDDEMVKGIHWISYKTLEARSRFKFLIGRKG